jgi:chitinase
VDEPGNTFPTANAGSGQTVVSGATVTLNGTASSDPDGSIASYSWTQTQGTGVTLTGANTAQPTFDAPTVTSSTNLRFSLVVTDNRGANSTASTVTIVVVPVSSGVVTLSGTVRYTRVRFHASSPFGLNYSDTVLLPARGVVVRAVDAANQSTVLATGVTGADGSYSLSVS